MCVCVATVQKNFFVKKKKTFFAKHFSTKKSKSTNSKTKHRKRNPNLDDKYRPALSFGESVSADPTPNDVDQESPKNQNEDVEKQNTESNIEKSTEQTKQTSSAQPEASESGNSVNNDSRKTNILQDESTKVADDGLNACSDPE